MTLDEMAEEVHTIMHKEMTVEELNDFFMSPYCNGSLTHYHTTLGRYIRNKYKLWSTHWVAEVAETANGADCSPNHPDQVSMTIIKEIWKKGFQQHKLGDSK